MSPEEELRHLRIRCANLEKSYREAYSVTVKAAREQALSTIIELLKSEEAKAQRHCHWLMHQMFGQTGEVLAKWLTSPEIKRKIIE